MKYRPDIVLQLPLPAPSFRCRYSRPPSRAAEHNFRFQSNEPRCLEFIDESGYLQDRNLTVVSISPRTRPSAATVRSVSSSVVWLASENLTAQCACS
jgi:hypothetical protein